MFNSSNESLPGFSRKAHIDDLDTWSSVFVTAHEWFCDKQKRAGIKPAGVPLIKTVRLGRPCCGTVMCFCVLCACVVLECAVHSEVVFWCLVHSRNPPGFSKLVIRKARGRE